MHLDIDERKIRRCRELAGAITAPLLNEISRHSTTSVERTVLRLWGVDGLHEDAPLPNAVAARIQEAGRLEDGVARPVAALVNEIGRSVQEVCEGIASGELELPGRELVMAPAVGETAGWLSNEALVRLAQARDTRLGLIDEIGEIDDRPLLYVIVATGNINHDIEQAVSAAECGADCIAVIRSTAQSLLDYVPHGATTEGFGGTYATQENFRLMRGALDETAKRIGRYVRLVNYASGLCMPEIAVLGALERLDMLLNDSMYGVIFRDINPLRTFVDQHFSRRICAEAKITINTGEDNYLTTADAVEAAHTVLASQFINESFALAADVPEELMGLGHAFEIDPAIPGGFLMELAQAQLVRQIFPKAPIKFMPPTKHMTGDIFLGYRLEGMFDLASMVTGQTIHLCGILTEALHTPLLHDRMIALEGARYVMGTAGSLGTELDVRSDGKMAARAAEVLSKAEELLEKISGIGLMEALARGTFADIKRDPEGGRGGDGCFVKAREYLNPFEDRLGGASAEKSNIIGVRGHEVARGARLDHVPGFGDHVPALKAYGDTRDDGMIQVSFTLPLPAGPKATEAGRMYARSLGLEDVRVACAKPAGEQFTFYVVYGRSAVGVDPEAIEVTADRGESMSRREVDAFLKEHLDRHAVVVGAALGSDAHTVGIDAIMNMKGFTGDYGLERYEMIDAHNLGSQVAPEELVRRAGKLHADAILVSQVVTQKNIHVTQLTTLVELIEAEGLREKILMVAGGPYVDDRLAQELGYDAGFGRGTLPHDVATFIARRLAKRGGS